jgi:starvation-inducible outer membrane lipoprotein
MKSRATKQNRSDIYKLCIVTLLAASLTACTTGRTTLKDTRAPQSVSFATAKENADAVKGANVRWGGQISEVVAAGPNAVELIVNEIPVYGSSKAPIYGTRSAGTFTARTSTPVDTTLFKEGEVITVSGRIVGQGSEGPQVQIDNVQFWQAQAEPDLAPGMHEKDQDWFDMRNPGGWTYNYVLKTDLNQHAGHASRQ